MIDLGIFTKGKTLKAKAHRQIAWIRAKMYWLTMPAKEYKRVIKTDLFCNVFTWMFAPLAVFVALWYGLAWIYDFVSDFIDNNRRKEKKEKES